MQVQNFTESFASSVFCTTGLLATKLGVLSNQTEYNEVGIHLQKHLGLQYYFAHKGGGDFAAQGDTPCILLSRSAVRVHDSQAFRKMDVTREHIRHILELREMLLSFQPGFSLVSAAVVCATLESISGFEPSSVITEPMYMT